ncbi:unnamed protein product [Mytilus coruscus]|uniref:Uncharacterized protein n=1 Tax=Mytilus coruscus TaxID=42192 RepID=A0A6J8BE45_MYTCO|nr:unnamed protein product [Mytilus coruscus]
MLETGDTENNMIKWSWYHSVVVLAVLGLVFTHIQDNNVSYVKDFSCVVYNWENVICKWNITESIEIKTVKVYWQPIVPFSKWYYCPKLTNSTSCEWSINDHNIDIERKHNISVSINNNLHNFFLVRWNESVYPDPVNDLFALAKNMSCVLLEWQHSDNAHNKTFKVMYKPERALKTKILTLCSEKGVVRREICHLKPYTRYEIQVTCKPDRKGIWSNKVRTTIRTNKTVPECPPSTDIGGYSWIQPSKNSSADVTIFWKQIEKSKWNGDKIQYGVYLISTKGITLLQSSGKFYSTFNIDTSVQYQAFLYSYNEIGNSTLESVQIPSYKDIEFVEEVVAVKDIESQTKLYWTSTVTKDTSSYNLFWCEQAFWDICKDTPHTIEISSADGHSYSTLPGPFTNASTYLFGVSYTSMNNMTSGFKWSDCYIDVNKEFHLKLQVTLYPKENGVLVKWRLPKCNFEKVKQLISYYNIHFCERKECEDYTVLKVAGTTDYTFIETTEDNVCVRVFPNWKDTDSRSSAEECVQISSNKRVLVSALLSVGAVFCFLAIFGCCMIVRKVRRTIKTIKRPFIIETPHIYNNSNQNTDSLTQRYRNLPSSNGDFFLLLNRDSSLQSPAGDSSSYARGNSGVASSRGNSNLLPNVDSALPLLNT